MIRNVRQCHQQRQKVVAVSLALSDALAELNACDNEATTTAKNLSQTLKGRNRGEPLSIKFSSLLVEQNCELVNDLLQSLRNHVK
jgi:hypothetical protein